MQAHHRVEQYDEKLNQLKEQMGKFEEEKGEAFKELKEMKKVAVETNVMVEEVLATKRISEPTREQQMGIKANSTESLKHESKKGSEFQLSEANAVALLSEYKMKVQELEAEIDKRKESEANLFDTLKMQTKELEHNKILLEESKLDIASLQEKIKAIQGGATQNIIIEGMKSEAKKEESDGLSTKAKTLLEELNLLKNELKAATEAEENSKKAMDDLAFALKEVATEANQVKAKLTLSEVELEHTKGDAERWRAMLESTEEKYKELLDVTRKEAERFKNTAERLRLEAEESLLAWNGKEMEFVNCIKRAEDERLAAQNENTRVLELFKEAEDKTKVSKDENQKLRDILKQALNESNVAKEAAEIAKAENARLQDSLSLLVHENEMLKIHEASSFENIKELKRLLSESLSSKKEFKNEDMEKLSIKEGNNKEDKESGKKAKAHSSADKEHKESKNLSKTFSLNLKDMITPYKQQHKVGNEEANKETGDDTLRGSIFDEVDSSDSESRHDAEIGTPEDFDHLDESQSDDPESERNSRKRRALLRRFGDLIRRRGYHSPRKEPSNEEHLQT
ncbi:WEB family protein At3g02930, chloroplastic [Gastrolobium bilobum]|uniref:WEB family protein At3g02930, chloroplastic n=1 Tax=Gastrolobium bilobum TaxID=150636 RepID=UPI002AAF9994|nr:WEB family protein At3g02930, chloroplastic [Gastrolobium bilobum]